MSESPVLTGTAGSLLFRLSRERLNGALLVEAPSGTARIVVRGEQILAVNGVPGLLASLADQLPDPSALSDDLINDVPVCIALGLELGEICEAACQRIGAFLAEQDTSPARFDPDAEPPTGSFPLPTGLLKLYTTAVTASDADDIAKSYRDRQKETLRVMVHPDEAEGLGPVVLRTLRAAWRASQLADLTATVRTPDRLRQTWTSLDLLVRMGLIEVGEKKQATEPASDNVAPDTAPLSSDLDSVAETAPMSNDEPADVVAEDSLDDLDLEYGDALSDLEADDEASDVFAMEGWDDEDEDEDEDEEVEVDSSSNALEDLLTHSDKTVAAMASFYTELLQAGPLVPLALQRDDLSDYITLELLRMRAHRALGRWHPGLHSQRSPEAQRASKELLRLVRFRLEALSSIEALAAALAELRGRFGWPQGKSPDLGRASAMHERAQALAREQAWEAAVVMSNKATMMAPNAARYRALDLLARVALQEMSPLSAVVNLNALQPEDDEERAVVQHTAGLVWERAERPGLALACYQQALSLAPGHEDAASRAESLKKDGTADADTAGLPSFFKLR